MIRANLLFLVLVVTVATRAAAADFTVPAPWKPSAGHTQISLWPKGTPHLKPADGPEVTGLGKKQVAGRPWT